MTSHARNLTQSTPLSRSYTPLITYHISCRNILCSSSKELFANNLFEQELADAGIQLLAPRSGGSYQLIKQI